MAECPVAGRELASARTAVAVEQGGAARVMAVAGGSAAGGGSCGRYILFEGPAGSVTGYGRPSARPVSVCREPSALARQFNRLCVRASGSATTVVQNSGLSLCRFKVGEAASFCIRDRSRHHAIHARVRAAGAPGRRAPSWLRGVCPSSRQNTTKARSTRRVPCLLIGADPPSRHAIGDAVEAHRAIVPGVISCSRSREHPVPAWTPTQLFRPHHTPEKALQPKCQTERIGAGVLQRTSLIELLS